MESFILRYKSEAGLLLGCLVVSYFLVFKTALTPPLKPKELIFSLSAVLELFLILKIGSGTTRPRPQFSLFFAAIVVYFLTVLLLTFSIPTSSSLFRDARGFVCIEDFVKIYGSCPLYVGQRTLMKFSFEPHRIWQEWSIDIVRYFVTTLWFVLVWFTVGTIAKVVKRENTR